MNVKLAEIKKADPKLTHSDAFQKAFNAWKVSLSFLPRCLASFRPGPGRRFSCPNARKRAY